MNKRGRTSGTSQYKGVYYDRRSVQNLSKRWKAIIAIDGKKTTCIGYFATEAEAAEAYNTAAKEHYGEFARLNQIEAGGAVSTVSTGTDCTA